MTGRRGNSVPSSSPDGFDGAVSLRVQSLTLGGKPLDQGLGEGRQWHTVLVTADCTPHEALARMIWTSGLTASRRGSLGEVIAGCFK